MPRKLTPGAHESCHITIRCNNKEFLFDLEKHFDAMVSWTNCLPLFFNIALHHVLFMNNHIHIFLTPQQDNLGNAMRYYLTNLAKYLNEVTGRKNHVFGGRYHPSVVKNQHHFANIIRYIYQNPVQARMVKVPEQYKFSSLRSYLGLEHTGFLLNPDAHTCELFNCGWEGRSLWIKLIHNTLCEQDEFEMQNSLNKRNFKFSVEQFKRLQSYASTLFL